jgi:hypothetical protein
MKMKMKLTSKTASYVSLQNLYDDIISLIELMYDEEFGDDDTPFTVADDSRDPEYKVVKHHDKFVCKFVLVSGMVSFIFDDDERLTIPIILV